MHCLDDSSESYLTHLTDLYACLDHNASVADCPQGALRPASPPPLDFFLAFEKVLLNRVIVVICAGGLLGNLLNLIALTSMLIQKPMDRMERSATVGLLALAVSDLLFCIAIMPYSAYDFLQVAYEGPTFMLYFHVYSSAVISTLVTASTWLTVVMAVSRYLAICRPLEARAIIGMKFAELSIVLAFAFSVLANLPKFWHHSYVCVHAPLGVEGPSVVYLATEGFLMRNRELGRAYYAVYLVIGIIAPLVVLAYCNVFLIRALRKSTRTRRLMLAANASAPPRGNGACANASSIGGAKGAGGSIGNNATSRQKDGKHGNATSRQQDATNTITLTLAIIVVMYVILVLPAEFSNIFTLMTEEKTWPEFDLAVAIGNTLQTINFSFNFVLYCVVNAHFRRIIRGMVTCKAWKRTDPSANRDRAVTGHVISGRTTIDLSVAEKRCEGRRDWLKLGHGSVDNRLGVEREKLNDSDIRLDSLNTKEHSQDSELYE